MSANNKLAWIKHRNERVACNNDLLTTAQMNDYLHALVTLVDNIYFKVNIIVPFRLFWRSISKITAFTVVIETWDLLCLKVIEVAVLRLLLDEIKRLHIFACWILREILHEFVQLTKHTEKPLCVDLLFYDNDRSIWLYVGAISNSEIDPQLAASRKPSFHLYSCT